MKPDVIPPILITSEIFYSTGLSLLGFLILVILFV